MTKLFAEGEFVIDANPEKVWNTLQSFAGVETYIPVMKSSVLEGSGVGATRYIKAEMNDGSKHEMAERIIFMDDFQKLLKFQVIIPIQFYLGNVKIKFFLFI